MELMFYTMNIVNAGEIEPEAFTLMGASTKRGDEEMIGRFGSGLKYAICFLIRSGIEFKVFSGKQEIVFDSVTKNFRGKKFDAITVNGEMTSLTTDMGPDWTFWQAMREIVCNAIDEGSWNRMKEEGWPEPTEGLTQFSIKMSEQVMEFFTNWNNYFTFGRKDVVEKFFDPVCGEIAIYEAPQKKNVGGLFRRGVLCVQPSRLKISFVYSADDIDINESRIAVNAMHEYRKIASRILGNSKNTYVIEKLLAESVGSMEFAVGVDDFEPGPALMSLKDTHIFSIEGEDVDLAKIEQTGRTHYRIPRSLATVLVKKGFMVVGEKNKPKNEAEFFEMGQRELKMVEKAVEFYMEARLDKYFGPFPRFKYTFTEDYNYKVVKVNPKDGCYAIYQPRAGSPKEMVEAFIASTGKTSVQSFVSYAADINQLII